LWSAEAAQVLAFVHLGLGLLFDVLVGDREVTHVTKRKRAPAGVSLHLGWSFHLMFSAIGR